MTGAAAAGEGATAPDSDSPSVRFGLSHTTPFGVPTDGEILGIKNANDFWGELTTGIPAWLWPIVAAVAISVVSTVLVPWLTVQRTKAMERRDKELVDRRDAAAALLRAAGDMYMEAEQQSDEPGSVKVYSLGVQQAAATVLILTTGSREEGREFLEDLPFRIFRGQGSFTLTLAEVLSAWIPKGRFAINDLPQPIRQLQREHL